MWCDINKSVLTWKGGNEMSDTNNVIEPQTDADNPEIEDTGDASERNRAWFLTLHIKNFENLGLDEDFYKDPLKLKQHLSDLWCNSGKDRSCAVVICESAQGLYHAHMACYCKGGITRNAIRELMGKCHCDTQLGNKKQMTEYLLKMGKHSEKGEKVLSVLGLDNVQNATKTDLLTDAMAKINEGYSVRELLSINPNYYRYEETLKKMYSDKVYDETPRNKEMRVYWHCGKSGTGKTEVYNSLVSEYGEDAVYFYSDFSFGGLDDYLCEPILFIDELRPDSMSYRTLLNLLSHLKAVQSHSRYHNKRHLWHTVHIATVFPPEEIYKGMVCEEQRKNDSYTQLSRRLTSIIYHYKNGKDEFKSFELPFGAYNGYEDLKELAALSENVDDDAEIATETITEMDF